MVRKRVASGVWTCDQRPVAVLPKERVIVVQQGGWEYCDADFHDDFINSLEVDPPHCRTGYAKGEVVGQAVPQPSPDSGSCQRFALVGQAEQFGILNMNRDKQRSKWIESIQLTFEDDSAIPVSSIPPTCPPSPPSSQRPVVCRPASSSGATAATPSPLHPPARTTGSSPSYATATPTLRG